MVTFPQMSGKTATQRILNIVLPDGTNGAAAIQKYDPSSDTPFTTIGPNNIALLKLDTPLTLDDSKNLISKILSNSENIQFYLEIVQKANVGTDADFAAFQTRILNYKFRACGIGQMDNNGALPKGVMCTDVNLVADICESTDDAVENAVCLQWTDRDNNM
jgi:hypothetical protein